MNKQKGISSVTAKVITLVLVVVFFAMFAHLGGTFHKKAQPTVVVTPSPTTIERYRNECLRRSDGCLIVEDGMVYPFETRGAAERVFIFGNGRSEQEMYNVDERVRTGKWNIILPDNPERPMFFKHYATGVRITK